MKQSNVTLAFESVLVPEIWIAVEALLRQLSA
jgi:hypothetical protein